MIFPAIELIDRYAIALVKFEKTSANPDELKFYIEQLKHMPQDVVELYTQQLVGIHKEIWSLESELKTFNEQHLPLEEIGRRAILIRNWNAKRVEIKNKFAEVINCTVREVKVSHLSQRNPTVAFLPKFWEEDYRDLEYVSGYVTSSKTEQMWLAQGHIKEAVIIAGYHNNHIMPKWVEKFADFFPDFENFAYSIHRMDPGRYFPIHGDHYNRYREVFGIEKNIDVYRMAMFFNDRESGQFYEVGDQAFSEWVAGQVFCWKNDTTHLAANLGSTPRYNLIVTCTKKSTNS
jgi:hypothetical protein